MTGHAIFIVTVSLALTALTGFQEETKSSFIGKISGKYVAIPECCDHNYDEIIIKNNYHYKSTHSYNLIGSWTINGTIILKSDTIIFEPKSGINYKGEKVVCKSKDNTGFCSTDTLIYMEDTLCSLDGNIKYHRK